MDGTAGGLKLTATGALERSRYRHEPYPRYHSTKVVTWVAKPKKIRDNIDDFKSKNWAKQRAKKTLPNESFNTMKLNKSRENVKVFIKNLKSIDRYHMLICFLS